MEFGSIAELESFAKSLMNISAMICAEEMIEIMKEKIKEAYNAYSPSMYHRTGDLLETPQIVSANADGMETEFEDNGGWFSLVGSTAGQHFFALEGLEGGHTWGRSATHIHASSMTTCYSEIPTLYIKTLQRMGVPIS